ncbi:NUDIX domain-containing protein [Ditylenchus destructor]|uniref:NUDIX domain-containing protein n=1 Tax=Ditylenchus destructor TaxID=166010 RepID=A0AAD4MUQ8_9BILA|nr:NUDIX domain-containing protein [Ditylenchus destructor]
MIARGSTRLRVDLSRCLPSSIAVYKWKNQDKKNAVWFRVHVQDGWWTSILSECGFEISHAEKPNTFVMIKWLLSTKSTIPLYPYTQIGVVGLIVDTKGLVLLVKEETQKGDFSWRLPGGAVDHGEHMYDALSRELREEIGIEVPQFSADAQKAPKPCLLAFRHDRLYAWQTFQGISAMMFLFVITTDDSQKIQLKLNDGEIQKAAWISSADAKTKLRGDFNRKALAKYEEWMKNGGKGCMSYENKPDRKEITNTDGSKSVIDKWTDAYMPAL